jgi:hypothetical protein
MIRKMTTVEKSREKTRIPLLLRVQGLGFRV